MLNFKRNLLSAALSAAALLLAFGAQAQPVQDAAEATAGADADATSQDDATAENEAELTKAQADAAARELDSVVVSGVRRGIEDAIKLKAESTSIVEAISAEDLGKLPDLSIADSIARLPGLAAQRVAGRASTISIRGLSGDYGTTLLNGREQVSVGDNRTVEFDQFPSELINQVVVYKTPDASLVGQGLSGTIDLRTVRPLSFAERTVSLNARAEKNSLGELNADSNDYGSRVSAFYLDKFMDDRLGIALGYARLDSPGQAERFESYGYPTDIGGANGAFTIGGAKAQASSTDNVRQGLMGVVEFNVNDSYQTTLDLYYSKFDKAETTRFLEVGLGWGGGVSLSNPVIDDGVVVSATFNNTRPVLRNDLNEGDDKLFAIGWNNQIQVNENWSMDVDLSYSKADREESILETYSGTRAGIRDNAQVVLNGEGAPTITFNRDFTDPAAIVLTDPGGWGQDGYIKKPQVDDELSSFRINAERSLGGSMFSSLQFGLNYSDREKTRTVPEAFLDLINDETVLPSDVLIRPVSLDFAGIPGSFSYNINEVLDRYYRLRANINSDIVNKQWSVQEELLTGFVQLNIDGAVGSIPMRGNLGLQAVSTDQKSRGFLVLQGDAANAIAFNGGNDYDDLLPSLNLVFSVAEEQTVRLGLARQQARPRIDQMRANNNTSLEFTGINQGRWSRNGGNPELEPWTANALDVSWEKYFGGKGYVSLAYFYKDLRTYIYDQNGFFDASGIPIPSGYVGPTPDTIGVFSRPANGEGGNLKGLELSVSIPFELFSEALEGFGFVGNHSDTRSGIKRQGPDGPDEPIAGLSRRVTNLTLYYDRYGFSTRISQRKRSDFLGEIQGFGADRSLVNIDGDEVLDLQVGYSFGEGSSLDGVSVLLQVNNLTNEPYRQYFSGNELTQRYEEYGRQYLLGVTYKF